MPRRLPVRPAKVFGNFFVLIVLTIISTIYYSYMFVVWGPRAKGKLLPINQIYRLLTNSIRGPNFYGAFMTKYSFVFSLDDARIVALLIVYNILFFMLLWSFF